ncbi:sugar phosphate isomerase/epimerase family protein [Pseudaminobacter soli (ex Li et al. 2025)]|uniref:Xylose isomerase n=1 Tax=Pseudaminobacter soli (ex Li et al. 2025) TaxID=1295366 RepID=A0A2P7SID7_9HYPH|nr:sugar phosphate isomerase/epimerase [Mesorhizobium soli]PSJ62250.1 xylose isomerase [Mesorhizobium soli]
MDWSFQLYSARNFQPWPNVLQTLARLGYRQIEGYGGVYDDPAGMRAELDRNGLSMPSGHFPIDMLERDFASVERIARTLGIDLLICPYLEARDRPYDAASWREFSRRLASIGNTATGAGFHLGWHNHDFEFIPLSDGSVPLAHVLDAAPNIGWEIDVAWVVRAGADVMDWIERHGARIVAVHVKDMAAAGHARTEDGWTDVGYGTINWPMIIKGLRNRTRARYYVLEHDNPSDYERFARRSIEAANNF